jgi:hypothetical protein
MAERALPAAPAPRTVTVRVRSLVIAFAMVAAAVAVVWSLRWATSLQPLTPGNGAVQVWSLKEDNASGVHPGAPVYVISGPRPRLVVITALHNGASVPVTITGIDPIGGDVGPLSPVGLRPADPVKLQTMPGTFHSVRIPADGTRGVALVFGVRPGSISCQSVLGVGPVRFHMTTLGFIEDTQAVDLGTLTPQFTGPCQ